LAVRQVVPTAKPTADFHRHVNAHAGRTLRKTAQILALRRQIYINEGVNFIMPESGYCIITIMFKSC